MLSNNASLKPGSWQYLAIEPLGISSSNSFIRLQPGARTLPAGPGTAATLYVTYRTATGCDSDIDPQFTNKLSVHTFYDGGSSGTAAAAPLAGSSQRQRSLMTAPARASSPTFLVALVPPGTQWTTSEMSDPEHNIVIHLVEELRLQGEGSASSSARIGVCRFQLDPSECNGSLSQQPKLVTSALPVQRCNRNGICESVFGENRQTCASDCKK